MVEREGVLRVAREKLGMVSRFATGEFTMLARLLEPDEPIAAMVLAHPGLMRAGQLLTATDRRLLILSKGMLTRREHVEDIPLGRVCGARAESAVQLVVELDDGEREFAFALPEPQMAAIVAVLRGEPADDRFAELDELARRKLGRMVARGAERELVVLAAALAPDEPVLDLAYATEKPSTLIAVCPDRLLVVPPQGLRRRTPASSIAYDQIDRVVDEEDELRLEPSGTTFRKLLPIGAAAVLAGRIGAKLR